MATTGTDDYLHPRARRPLNAAQLLSGQQDEVHPGLNGKLPTMSALSSGRTTPIPVDAPPSVKATSSARKQIRAQQKHRLFPTVVYEPRVSHFDKNSDYRDFRGFFVLFWIGLAIMVMTTMLRNYKETGTVFAMRQWGTFTQNVWEMFFSDLAMASTTALALPLHRWYNSNQGLMRWSTLGMAVQSIFQAVWLAFWVNWPFLRQWTWTAQVFFTLHLLTLFMKMHSYAFYNGHLSETRRRLNELDTPETASTQGAAYRYPSRRTHLHEIQDEDDEKENDDLSSLRQLREDLAFELTSPLGHISYPQNLTLYNYVDFLFCPTLCYELEYPRTERIQWLELFYKALAVFGCIFLMTITSDEFIIPVLQESALLLQGSTRFSDSALILAETISRLLFPFMIIFLLVFLVIFEYVLGAFAEITRFADRQFYADWWNSCDWLEFSREWNIPVHHFLRRHVFSASRGHTSRPVATVITFLISAAAHELVMGVITKKLRGYGAFAMMLQIPIVVVQRSKWVRGRKLLNNVLFWCSMILGLSMMCALYVLV
ncbi:sterol O-acyltransferase 1 [Patellaria atrata CBS 101060]|uniref:O-acyltransferase n=1 Tax=Patellaria atrata CBS 101060 TaxID=1346257 RepID=A0A9P4VLP4_9PEZI|nr:sterol O-acyltransferase 1 [Patellaria atrata CBS 101060]